MIINTDWIKDHNPCSESLDFLSQNIDKKELEFFDICYKQKRYDWINWGALKFLKNEKKTDYILYSLKKYLPIYELVYTNDDAPRKQLKNIEDFIKKRCKNLIFYLKAANNTFYMAISNLMGYAYCGKYDIGITGKSSDELLCVLFKQLNDGDKKNIVKFARKLYLKKCVN
jgi:hypothetical protein